MNWQQQGNTVKNNIILKSLYLCLNRETLGQKYKTKVSTKIPPCSLFCPFLPTTGLWVCSKNMSCSYESSYVGYVDCITWNTGSVFLYFGKGLLQAKQEMKSFWPVCPRWSSSWPGGRSWVQSPGVVPRSRTLYSLNSVNDCRECRGKPPDQKDPPLKRLVLLYLSRTQFGNTFICSYLLCGCPHFRGDNVLYISCLNTPAAHFHI